MTSHKIDPNFSLANKVAMITGGAAGIGRAIADLFAEKGAKLVLVDKSDSVRDVAAEFSAKGLGCDSLSARKRLPPTPTGAVH
jgi:NAD(P)-dependent dehydrogenase (short-subunit alcohol dehydrogenase family)